MKVKKILTPFGGCVQMEERVIVKVVRADSVGDMDISAIPFEEDEETVEKKKKKSNPWGRFLVFLVFLGFAAVVAITLEMRGIRMIELLLSLKWYQYIMGGGAIWLYSRGESMFEG